MGFGRSGDALVAAAPASTDLQRTLWRMPRAVASDPDSRPRIVATLEDTPFYARSAVETTVFGLTAPGVHESLSLDRFRTAAVQWMLPFRMPRRLG